VPRLPAAWRTIATPAGHCQAVTPIVSTQDFPDETLRIRVCLPWPGRLQPAELCRALR
jgi:hypothetical protein